MHQNIFWCNFSAMEFVPACFQATQGCGSQSTAAPESTFWSNNRSRRGVSSNNPIRLHGADNPENKPMKQPWFSTGNRYWGCGSTFKCCIIWRNKWKSASWGDVQVEGSSKERASVKQPKAWCSSILLREPLNHTGMLSSSLISSLVKKCWPSTA